MDWRRDQADFCLGPMLSKNALPQITCCGGDVFICCWLGVTAWSASRPNCHATYAIDAHT